MKTYFLERLFPDNQFRDGDEEIIQTMITMLTDQEKMDIRNVAQKNYTSPASISRLTKRAGFSNYKEFLFQLRSKIIVAHHEVGEFDFAKSNRSSVETEYMLRQVLSSPIIYLYGEGFCEPIIDYVYRKLLQSGLICVNLRGIEINLMNNQQAASLLTVSQSGENSSALYKIQETQENGGRAIAFTATSNSSFEQEADLCFTVDAGKAIDADNTTFNYFYGNTINLLEYLINQYVQQQSRSQRP